MSKNLLQSCLGSKKAKWFEQLNKPATRLRDFSETRIDHFITRNLENFIIEVLENECFSDHYPVISKVGFFMKIRSSVIVTMICHS